MVDPKMDFSLALRGLRSGQRLAREGWNGKDLYVRLCDPEPTQTINLPFFYLAYPNGDCVPWVPSQTDLLADDWRIV